MVMGIFWTLMVTVSLVYGAVSGRLSAVTAAALEGAAAAVELVLVMAGALCLWSGVLELMRRSGMAVGCSGTASDELCRLVVLNTASVQLLPTTVAAVRAGCGAAAPFDILPAVWISSLLSVSVGLLTARLLERVVR